MMESSTNAASQQVSINKTAPSAYNVVCNKCISSPKFAHFDDFLDHSHAEHGPTVRRSALSIIPEDTFISARGSVSHLSAHSGASTNFTGSSASNNTITNHDDDFDLKTLKRQCMVDIIELLNKCFCIWHRPTRESMPRSERLYAYQLVLMKLREHVPFATFRDARSIVRQIIRSYLRRLRMAEGDGVSRKSRTGGVNQSETDERQEALDIIKSKVVLEKLDFLQGCDEKDVEELIADKHCDFCNIGFHNTETLWTHMVSAHLPARKQQCAASIAGSIAQPTESTVDSISLNRKRTRSRMSRSTIENDETDATQQSFAGSEPSCLRRSRRRKRDIWRSGRRGRGKNKVVTLKRLRRRRRSTSKSGDDASVTTKSSTLYLADYSDKFLEEFIDLYQQQECLWRRDSPMFRSRKLKEAAYDILHKKYCQWRKVPSVSINKIKSLIRRLRNYYERLQHPNANPYRGHIWQRMSFIDQFQQSTPTTPTRRRSRSTDTVDYDCRVCLRKFKRAKACASHMLKTHPPTECPRCNETFNNADELVRHLLFIHRKDAQCPLCQEAGDDVWKSPEHLNTHFYVQRCLTCTETFHDFNNFRRHRSKCRNINRYRCKYCSLKFTSTMDFRRHAKASHQDERPFKCDDCEISFKYLAPLAKHRKLHKRMQNNYYPA